MYIFDKTMSQFDYASPVSALLTYGSCNDVAKRVFYPENEPIRKEMVALAAAGKSSTHLLAQIRPVLMHETWPDYLGELGITLEHVPELIRMATDEGLSDALSDSVEVWAPIHAWRCLGLLRADEAIEPLLGLIKSEEEDWVLEEIPWVMGLIGEGAIAPATKFLANRGKNDWLRGAASKVGSAKDKFYSQSR